MQKRHTSRARRLWLGPVIAVAVSALALTSCASPAPQSTSSAEPTRGGEITFARLSSPITSLDPNAKVLVSINAYTLDKIFDTLYALDSQGQPQPSLATSYSVSPDGLTWTFKLRSGVQFSDGSAFDSSDVVYSIKRHLKIGGALPLGAPITGVTAPDASTVDIKLSAPYTPLLSELSIFSSSILPDGLGGESESTFFANPIGTGPFKVGQWDKTKGTFTLIRNDKYWVAGLPYLDKVNLTTVSDDNQLVAQVQSGQADIVDSVPTANVADLKANPAVQVLSVGSWNQDVVFFNTASAPFSSRSLRRAVVEAVDRSALTQATTFGTATAARTYIPTNIRYSDQKVPVLAYDQAAAKKELAAANLAAGSSVTLTVEGGSQSRSQQAQVIQESLAAIGIDVKIKTLETGSFWSKYPTGDYQFALTSVVADTGDPDNVSSWQVDGTGSSHSFYTQYNNPTVNALVKEGRRTPDGDARGKIYSQIQELVAQDSPSLPLDYVSVIDATTARVHGLELIPNGTVRLDKVWISQ